LGSNRLDNLLLRLDLALVVLAVAQHPEVPRAPAVGVDRDAGQDLLTLLQSQSLQVEVREADPVRGVRRILAVVRGHRLGEALQVLGDLPGRVGHLFGEGSAGVIHWEAMATTAQPVDSLPAGASANDTGGRDGERREVIRTVELTKVYPGMDVPAVDKLDLSVYAGEIFGLLGPNGAGKTTTAGMLTTRVLPTSGTAYVGAVDVVAHPALAKQLIGIVSQQNTLDRQLTVWENLYFHGRLFGISASDSRSKADELLEQLHLSKWAKASVYALSGGMAQRLMMARAIFHRPAVLFLDEPTAGLDPQSRLALWEILGELNEAGQTILLTTHYMEEAEQLCARVAIMDHGKILALDTPAALKQSVGADTIVTVKADGDTQALSERLAEQVEGVTKTRLIDGGVELHVTGPERLVPRVVGAAESGGFDLVDLSISEPSLETVFISLTGKELRD
jgi:ABC-2 type transport system ATP-binding protein